MKTNLHLPRLALVTCALLLTACEEVAPGTGPKENAYDEAVAATVKSHEAVRSHVAAEGVALKHVASTMPPSVHRDAVNDSADVILANTGAPSAADEAAALRRTNLVLAGERDKALGMLKDALDAGTKLSAEVTRLAAYIETLKAEKQAERVAAAARMKEQQDAWVIRCLVGACIGSFLLFGLSLYVAGPVLGARQGWPFALVGFGFLCAARLYGSEWFARVLGVVCIAAVIATAIGAYHLWRTGQIEKRLRAAAQDLKDESKTLAENGVATAKAGWGSLKEHLLYRIPRVNGERSAIEREIDRRNVAEGLNT